MSFTHLLAQIDQVEAHKIPPVEQWTPAFSGDIDILIKADGSWWHEGELMQRQALVTLFSSILKYEEEQYYLVTPVEKWRIRVEDRPLHIHLVSRHDDHIQCLTTATDAVVINTEHPLKMSLFNGTSLPEVKIRHNLWARLTRNAWYELLQFAEETDEDRVLVRSAGLSFSLSD